MSIMKELYKVMNPTSAGKGFVKQDAFSDALAGAIFSPAISVIASKIKKAPITRSDVLSNSVSGVLSGGIFGSLRGLARRNAEINKYRQLRRMVVLGGGITAANAYLLNNYLNKKTIDTEPYNV